MNSGVNLSFRGVSFCLVPDNGDGGKTPKSSPSIVSVRRVKKASSSRGNGMHVEEQLEVELEELVAELREFTGTLRISLAGEGSDGGQCSVQTVPLAMEDCSDNVAGGSSGDFDVKDHGQRKDGNDSISHNVANTATFENAGRKDSATLSPLSSTIEEPADDPSEKNRRNELTIATDASADEGDSYEQLCAAALAAKNDDTKAEKRKSGRLAELNSFDGYREDRDDVICQSFRRSAPSNVMSACMAIDDSSEKMSRDGSMAQSERYSFAKSHRLLEPRPSRLEERDDIASSSQIVGSIWPQDVVLVESFSGESDHMTSLGDTHSEGRTAAERADLPKKEEVPEAVSPTNQLFQKLLCPEAIDAESLSPVKTPFSAKDRPFRSAALFGLMMNRAKPQIVAGIDDSKTRQKALADGKAMLPALGHYAANAIDHNVGKAHTRKATSCQGPSGSSPLIFSSSTTELHRICADSGATLSRLRSVLEANPDAAAVPNSEGYLPIHIVAGNEEIVRRRGEELRYRRRRDDVGTFIRDLTDVYPAGMVTADGRGNIPLSPIIEHWIYNVLKAQEDMSSGSGLISAPLSKFAFGMILGDAAAESSGNKDLGSGTPRGQTSDALESCAVEDFLSERSFPNVFMPSVVEWALVMLSQALDNFGSPLSRDREERQEQLEARRIIAEHVANIPYFFKTVLLIEDDETRGRIMELSIVRRALFCKGGVGRWIIRMLRKPGIPSRRVVDYFIAISRLDVSDYIGVGRGPRSADYKHFNEEKDSVFRAIQQHEAVIPSLTVLPERDQERAATSMLMWNTINKVLSRPFVVGIVLIDFVLHLSLMIGLRIAMANAGVSVQLDSLYVSDTVNQALVMTIAIHIVLRKASNALHLLSTSWSVFRSYFMDFWNVIDVLAVVFACVATTVLDNANPTGHPVFMALTMCLLWLRLLGLLKAVNQQLATFVLSVAQIVKDIRWYLAMAIFIVFMFADMIWIATTHSDDGEYCRFDTAEDESGVLEDFCSRSLLKSYLRMYAVFVGDFELDDYRTTPFVAFLFAMFLLIGAIILLNVLIAIVSESYEKSRIRSVYLFGRARVGFAAEQSALESFLVRSTPREHESFSLRRPRDLRWLCGRVMRGVVLLSLLATAVAVDYFLVAALITAENALLLVVVVVLLIILNVALTTVFRFIFEHCTCCSGRHCRLSFYQTQQSCKSLHRWKDVATNYFSLFMDWLVGVIVRRIYGLNPEQGLDGSEGDGYNSDGEWGGRLDYMTKQVSLVVSESEQRLSVAVKESAKRLKEHETQMQKELKQDTEKIMKCIEQTLS